MQQLRQLHYQLERAEHTRFGRKYNFTQLLRAFSFLYTQPSSEALRLARQAFAEEVPTFTYERMYQQWWHTLRDGATDVSWPGRITHFALSSGTSQATTKYIPVTPEMLKYMQLVGVRQLCALTRCGLPLDFFNRPLLFMSGSTLQHKGSHMEGDISGMMTQRVPFWFRYHYLPPARVTRLQDWEKKLDVIVKNAPYWQVGGVSGSPTWVQLLLERILDHYGLSTIHDIWPGLDLFVHGGVAFESYGETFAKMLDRPLVRMETYLASEGFIAYQAGPARAMRLALDAGLFYEFVPFSPKESPQLSLSAPTYSLSEVEVNKPYSLIISNLSGLWRYVIGDVVVFRSLHPFEISIVGRTQHYLNLCGEHLCLSNLQAVLAEVNADLGLSVKEFTVFGERINGRFVHNWHIGVEQDCVACLHLEISKRLDKALQARNADYSLQRQMMLAPPQVKLVHHDHFYAWLRKYGKFGGQHKFPRVLKGARLQSWLLEVQDGNQEMPSCQKTNLRAKEPIV